MTNEEIIKELPEEDKVVAQVIDTEMSREEERKTREQDERERALEEWKPKTELGKEVRAGKIKNIDEIFKSGRKILEPQIVDSLLKLDIDMLNVGQAKGKFGGGKRRAWRQTQKKTKEGNIATFAVLAVVGNADGYIGIGVGRAKETLPAKEKAIRKAKLNIMKIQRGCGSFDCSCEEQHSIPFEVTGKCSSVRVLLIPAPQGTGLVVGDELKKILKLAGIKDVYSKSWGQKRTTLNFAKACMHALSRLGAKQ
jgi:small subunit ribosomal protein S5